MLAGLWGSGNGTNTFGENVGTIGKSRLRKQLKEYESDYLLLVKLARYFELTV